MRRLLFLLSLVAVVFTISATTSSCTRKVGCPANEAAHVKPNRKGELPTSGGRTQLFPGDFNKKKKKRKRRG
jgi:hypothetical protein